MTTRAGRVAITGTASFLGASVLRRLVERHGRDAVVALDIAPPPATLGVSHRLIDLAEPTADQKLLTIFREEDVDDVLHLAFFTNPQRDRSYSHEVESIGTLHLLAAAAAAEVERVVVRSFTAVYGARGQNPNFLTEERPLHASPGLPWARDKVEAEQHAASFAKRFPKLAIIVLRLAPLFGPGVRTFYTRLFDKRLVPVVMGYDPLVQLLHPGDAVRAFETALEHDARGPYNIVPSHSIPLVAALHFAEKVTVPVPHLIGYPTSDWLWSLGLSEAPGALLDYARFPFVADGAKAERELGFVAEHSSRSAIEDYLRYRYPQPERRGVAQEAEA